LYGQCLAVAQINFPESGRGLGHMTLQFLAVRSAILATAWLLVYFVLRWLIATQWLTPQDDRKSTCFLKKFTRMHYKITIFQ